MIADPRQDDLPRKVPGEAPALSIRHLSKRFGSSLVLNDVALDVMPGEVHGLLGQNGSGKSTLIKVLAGFHDPEPGAELSMYGEAAELPMPAGAARRLGIAFVHQHLGLIPSLSVLENLLLGDLAAANLWRIDWRREAAKARETFARFGLDIDPRARIGDLPQVSRALVAIVRAFEDVRQHSAGGRGLLILDEPTPFLPKAGVDQLFGLVRGIVKAGASVIFVSHDIDEIREITDRATILRDGNLAGTVVSKTADHDQFIELIVGRRVSLYQAEKPEFSGRPVAATIRNAGGGLVDNVSFDVRKGEIVGLTGLIGSGSDALPYLLYGAKPATSGTIEIAGNKPLPLAGLKPGNAMAAKIAFLPADRLGAAGVGNLTIADNMSLPVLTEFRNWSGLDWGAITERARQLGQRYDVRPNRPELNLSALSGGNAQKVLMAKWLQTEPALLMLDEPTQGVDVGARQHLFAALDSAAEKGTSILVASTDSEQLAQICHRVLVFARGRIVKELTGAEITKDRIAEECLRSMSSATLSEAA
ncbi:sugar ABC transporter ATP-binding protein [Kaistia dalseonensis]|uniref:Ribose transport system ATP-binding protein n=1 Tax=Kaistia dalseonensis TaxID=410840 RepID=A0ABU0H424_9HYPH|nr:sugar ABC transporter ATP-binding protein [Kaistia dalseonensis]MCX5494479.1 sugar ABC transporter ATP-binding protein [Kaistia dalseonensis]MDQ0437058.1 ribose transport system ATP-binding protein [Kaistia dalseonensis]